MGKSNQTGLIVFLRAPVEGKVKTRIAASLGDQEALDIYRELIKITFTLACTADMSVYIFYDGPLSTIPKQDSFNYITQIPGELGIRMQHAFEIVLQSHDKAIIIGSDCPLITNKDLSEAENLLDKFDCVLGPAEDGGYYLLGSKNVTPLLFQSMTWSTSTVLQETIQKLKQSETSYSLLRALPDIDTAEDWNNYKLNRAGQDQLPAAE